MFRLRRGAPPLNMTERVQDLQDELRAPGSHICEQIQETGERGQVSNNVNKWQGAGEGEEGDNGGGGQSIVN